MTQQQQQQGAPKYYTQRFKGSNGPKLNGKPMPDKMPDSTVHLPPIALFVIGSGGSMLGVLTNIWQMITTFVAFWAMFNPGGRPIDFQKQPVLIGICALISISFQFALSFLVFRLDTSWKKKKENGESKAAMGAAIEVVQQADLVLIWSLLGFIVDTVGDFTFISLYTGGLDEATSIFLIFIYAVALYALSTIGFVRSLEYVWAAGSAIARQIAGH